MNIEINSFELNESHLVTARTIRNRIKKQTNRNLTKKKPIYETTVNHLMDGNDFLIVLLIFLSIVLIFLTFNLKIFTC